MMTRLIRSASGGTAAGACTCGIRTFGIRSAVGAAVIAMLVTVGLPGGGMATATAEESVADAIGHATALSKAFRHAAEVATPSVVVVRSESKARPVPGGRPRQRGENPFRGTPFEGMFPDGLPEGFEQGLPEGMPRRSGVGSGVIVDGSGIVLTNNHVVEGADEVTVRLSDGREFTAIDIKTDPDSDLAVLRLEGAGNLPTARLGDSDSLSIGDWVIAIGNPFDLETTVSAGIISGKGRELGSIRRAHFLQTDAAINPGNSGGPLVNLAGEVIGINTAIASSSGGYQGVGFAIPVNLAKWVSRQLIDKGQVERAFIGVQMGPLDVKMAAKLGADPRGGVLVSDVVPGSPADDAGVRELDVITAFDDQPVAGTRSLQEMVERATIGQNHRLTVLRDGKPLTLAINVRPLPGDLARAGGRPVPPREVAEETFYAKDFGLEVRDKSTLTEDPYDGFDGVVVDRVDPEGLAAQAGLGPGVLIRAVGRTDVATTAEFAAAIERESPGEGALLRIRTPRGNAVVLLKN